MIIYGMEKPNTINPAFQLDRTPRGKFLPLVLRDALGRRMVVVDLREVERRLKHEGLMVKSELFDMRVAFAHHHVNNGHNRDDSCAVCGLDLRDKVHSSKYLEAQRVKGMSRIATIIHGRSSEK